MLERANGALNQLNQLAVFGIVRQGEASLLQRGW